MKIKHLILVFAILTTGSCYDDYDNTKSTESPREPVTLINTKLVGSFIDASGAAIPEYTAHVGGESIPVDGGYFLTSLTATDKHNLTITAEASDGSMGIAHLPLIENDINTVTIIPMGAATSEILTDESSIQLSPAAALQAVPVAGSAEVTTRVLLAAEGVLSHVYATNGSLQLIDDVAIYHISVSAGAANLGVAITGGYELYTLVDGRWLQVPSEGDNARDLTTGYYATGRAESAVFVSGTVLANGVSASYHPYRVRDTRAVTSTAKGQYIQAMAAGSQQLVELLDPCQQIAGSATLEVPTIDAQIDLSTGSEVEVLPVNTVLIDCDGDELDSPAIQLQYAHGTTSLFFFENATVSASVPVCDGQYEVAAYNYTDASAGLAIPWSSEIEDDIAFLNSCSEGYSYYSIGEFSKLYPAFEVSVTPDLIYIQSADGNMVFSIKGDGKGAYDVEDVNIKIYDEGFGDSGFAVSCENSTVGCGITDCYVSHLPSSDGLVRVSFSGNIWMQTLDPLTASTYKVEGIFVGRE